MSSLLIRLCLLMVAAFGSRPCGVLAVERPQAPLIVGLRARDVANPAAQPRESRAHALFTVARGLSTVRAPAPSYGTRASASPVEGIGWRFDTHAPAYRSARIPRRVPCAGCGDGAPYDATAPPVTPVTRV